MIIHNINFDGHSNEKPWGSESVAMKNLNEWRVRNPHIRVISIETIQKASSNDSRLLFASFRVWYEE